MKGLFWPVKAYGWLFGALLSFLPLSSFAASALELAQIHANRAVGSLAMYRGEGQQKPDAARLENDLAALASAINAKVKEHLSLKQATLNL